MSTTELFIDPGTELVRGAVISDDGMYRYRLWRTWQPDQPRMVWIMLNPSTADAEVDDPTIRRCINFAKREGFGGIEVLNLYAYRATKPEELLTCQDPEGPDNSAVWLDVLCAAPPNLPFVVAAWGARAASIAYKIGHPWTNLLVTGLRHAQSLGTTADGAPRHPLYVKADTPFQPWSPIPPQGR